MHTIYLELSEVQSASIAVLLHDLSSITAYTVISNEFYLRLKQDLFEMIH